MPLRGLKDSMVLLYIRFSSGKGSSYASNKLQTIDFFSRKLQMVMNHFQLDKAGLKKACSFDGDGGGLFLIRLDTS